MSRPCARCGMPVNGWDYLCRGGCQSNYCTCAMPEPNTAPFWLPNPGDCRRCNRLIRICGAT